MSVQLGINPLTWTNDDLPSLGAETSLETCLSEGKRPVLPASNWAINSREKRACSAPFCSATTCSWSPAGIPAACWNAV